MPSDGDLLLAHVRRELERAEWHDKVIYPCQGPDHQNWTLSLWLPINRDATERSPEAGLEQLLKNLREAHEAHHRG